LGDGDGDEFFLWGWVWDSEIRPRPALLPSLYISIKHKVCDLEIVSMHSSCRGEF